jgi:hypothetical protein
MLIQLDNISNITSADILQTISVYLLNPYPVKISKQKKIRNFNRIRVEISDEDYYAIKTANPKLRVDEVVSSLIKNKHNELYYGSLLFSDKNLWKREVIVKNVGRIDGLNNKEKLIVELKFFDGWKSALGQVLSYHVFDPDYKKEVCLLMKDTQTQTKKDIISSVCSMYNVSVRFIDLVSECLL